MKELKKAVEKKSDITVTEQQLIFGGKQLENDKDLEDYPALQSMCTIFLVIRLPGGSSDSNLRAFPVGIPPLQEPCSHCFGEPSLKMPCSHIYCPNCVFDYSWNEANSRAKKTEIKCSMCKSEWDLLVIQRYSSASKTEMDALAKKLSENFVRGMGGIRECPGCGHYCERKDKTKTRVYCRQCAKENREAQYCFYCSAPWKNPSSTTDCGNPKCNGILDIIRTAPNKNVIGVECPSIRMCPTCGALIEHEKACKHMKCTYCSTNFCFICLRTTVNSIWQCGAYNTKCTPAPIQTVIPKK